MPQGEEQKGEVWQAIEAAKRILRVSYPSPTTSRDLKILTRQFLHTLGLPER